MNAAFLLPYFLTFFEGAFDILSLLDDAPWGGLFPAASGLSLGSGMVLVLWFFKYRFARPFVEFYGKRIKR